MHSTYNFIYLKEFLVPLSPKSFACAAPTTLVSKADAVAMYPASQSNFTVSPPLKYKIITYTVSGANSVATLTCASFPPPCACAWPCVAVACLCVHACAWSVIALAQACFHEAQAWVVCHIWGLQGLTLVAACRFNLLNWRQSTVFYYLGATTTHVSAGPGVESTFTVLSGKNFGSATVTQANPYEPTQASTLAVAALQGALLMIFLA